MNNLSQLSYFLWIKPSSLPDAWKGLIGKRLPISGYKEVGLWLKNDDLYIETTDDNANTLGLTAYDVLTIGEWQYVGATIDYDAGKMKLYRNGKLIAERNISTGTTFYDDSTNLNIGMMAGGYFNGYIDEVKIYNYARTAEIR